MELNELVKEINKGENESREFKHAFSTDNVGKAICAFANSHGGLVFLGIDNDKKIVGVISGESLLSQVNSVASTCSPPAKISIKEVPFEKGKHIVMISVSESEKKPCKWKNITYKRVGPENIACATEEEIRMAIHCQDIQFDSMQANNEERQALLQDIDEGKIRDYIDKVQRSRNKDMNFSDVKQFLINNKLYFENSGKLTNAAILLFGKNPQNFIKNSRVTFSIFNSDKITEDFSKQFVSGTLLDEIDYCIELIQRFAPPWSEIKGTTRIDKTPYPYEALRELVTNAIVHKDYFIPSEVNIKLFNNRIEISNPGGLMPGIEPSLLVKGKNSLSVKRNMLLADILDKAKFMEQSGQGIPRVLRLIAEHGLDPPVFDFSETSFKITLFSNPENIKATKSEIKGMGSGEARLLKLILKSKGPISNSMLIKKTKYSPVWVNRLTTQLVEKEQIKKIKRGKEVYFSR